MKKIMITQYCDFCRQPKNINDCHKLTLPFRQEDEDKIAYGECTICNECASKLQNFLADGFAKCSCGYDNEDFYIDNHCIKDREYYNQIDESITITDF